MGPPAGANSFSVMARYPSFFAFSINSEPNCRADRPDNVISMSRISDGFSRLFNSSLTTTWPSLARTFGMVRGLSSNSGSTLGLAIKHPG
jgi:hypothetical protein